MEKNYKLSDGKYFHFHTNEEGYYYAIYDENGVEIDGGLLEYSDKNMNEKQILDKLSILVGLSVLSDKEKRSEVKKEIIEELEEREYNKIQERMNESDKEKEEINEEKIYGLC